MITENDLFPVTEGQRCSVTSFRCWLCDCVVGCYQWRNLWCYISVKIEHYFDHWWYCILGVHCTKFLEGGYKLSGVLLWQHMIPSYVIPRSYSRWSMAFHQERDSVDFLQSLSNNDRPCYVHGWKRSVWRVQVAAWEDALWSTCSCYGHLWWAWW